MYFKFIKCIFIICSIVRVGASTILDQAQHLYNTEQYDQAENLLREFLKHNPKNGDARVALGVTLHTVGKVQDGLDQYLIARNSLGDSDFLLANAGRALWQLDRSDEVIEILLPLAPKKANAAIWNVLGLAYHSLGREEDAVECYRKAIQLEPQYNRGEAEYNLAISLNQLGFSQDAADHYNKAISINPAYSEALVNLAALYHENLLLKEAIEIYKKVIGLEHVSKPIREMTKTNMATAMIEMGNAVGALEVLLKLVEETSQQERGLDDSGHDIYLMTLVMIARRVVCDWTAYDGTWKWLLENVFSRQVSRGVRTSLLPFDTLLLPTSPEERKLIAISHAKSYPQAPQVSHKPIDKLALAKRLRIGYLSYDYTDHPTAHLVEALFHHHNSSVVSSYALSYGKDDNSPFRERIKKEANHFLDLASHSHQDAIDAIVKNEVHIVMDMQGFTRGGRPQICMAKPAPIVVNYLVFPGTSGSEFTDYFIGDRWVTPPELAPSMTERLVIMPNCYQVNHYLVHHDQSDDVDLGLLISNHKAVCKRAPHVCDGLLTPSKIRRERKSSSELVVFCNFNKNDKLDPHSFDTWMAILKKVPSSILWLLEPSRSMAGRTMVSNLEAALAKHGLDASTRLFFAPRVPKAVHLQRHQHADLFLDTFVYGAHSTATDALFGKLPVLSIRGDTIPSRVAHSLLGNLGGEEFGVLAVEDTGAFINTAVRLVTPPFAVLNFLVERLGRVARVPFVSNTENESSYTVENWERDTAPLFRSDKYTEALEDAFQVMWELKLLGYRTQHIILSNLG